MIEVFLIPPDALNIFYLYLFWKENTFFKTLLQRGLKISFLLFADFHSQYPNFSKGLFNLFCKNSLEITLLMRVQPNDVWLWTFHVFWECWMGREYRKLSAIYIAFKYFFLKVWNQIAKQGIFGVPENQRS